jgi:hypothetical protein
MIRVNLALTALTVLSGCARGGDMVPLNPAAQALGSPRIKATLYGTGYGPVVIHMPSGETRNGHYRLAIGAAPAPSSAI